MKVMVAFNGSSHASTDLAMRLMCLAAVLAAVLACGGCADGSCGGWKGKREKGKGEVGTGKGCNQGKVGGERGNLKRGKLPPPRTISRLRG